MEQIESISIIWGKRKENTRELSIKICNALNYISRSFPSIFPVWYNLGYTISDASKQSVLIEENNIEIILEGNADKKFPDLGTKVALWNGKANDEDQASFSSRLGLFAENNNFKNNFVLRFPENNNLKLENLKTLISYLYNEFLGEVLKINGEFVDINHILKD